MSRHPFSGLNRAVCWLPQHDFDPFDPIGQFCELLTREWAELKAELGTHVSFGTGEHSAAGPADDEGWCLIGPGSSNPLLRRVTDACGRRVPDGPVVWIDRGRRIVAIDGPDLAAVGEAFQLLRTATREGLSEIEPHIPGTTDDMIAVVEREVADTYPAFGLRGIDWSSIMARHRDEVAAEAGSVESLQRLFAELEDAHTWVRANRMQGRLPYRAWWDGTAATLVHVPTWSAGWEAGARPGDKVLVDDGEGWWTRTAATPRTRPLLSMHRWLMGVVGEQRTITVSRRLGGVAAWTEAYGPVPWRSAIDWNVRPSGTGYLRIRGWTLTPAWLERLDTAFTDLSSCPRLIVDLRGNIGGQLIAALRFRDRFLPERAVLGSVRFSTGDGALSDPEPITGAPAGVGPYWHKPVRFLVDRQTYSASEDAILGLSDQPHVQIVGEPTGGGSGRPRTIRLTPEVTASVSTALTYDLRGRCVEGAGVAVDRALPMDAHFADPAVVTGSHLLDLADADW